MDGVGGVGGALPPCAACRPSAQGGQQAWRRLGGVAWPGAHPARFALVSTWLVQEIFPVAYYGLRTQSTKFGRWKFIEYPGGFELYNLDEDPHETDNVFDQAPPVSPGCRSCRRCCWRAGEAGLGGGGALHARSPACVPALTCQSALC